MSRAFWSFIYSVFGLFGGISNRPSRKPEIYCFLFAAMFGLAWVYALVTNLSANMEALPQSAILIGSFVVAGLFFRHVRLRLADDVHYLARKRGGN